MKIANPYLQNGTWYRGSLHIHSTFSVCGWHGIEELALAYRDYDFMAVSDHDRVTTETEALKDHVLFRGVEVSGDHHMLLAGNGKLIPEDLDHTFSVAHYGQLAEDAVAAALAARMVLGDSLADTARWAVGAGALACEAETTINPAMCWDNIETILNRR